MLLKVKANKESVVSFFNYVEKSSEDIKSYIDFENKEVSLKNYPEDISSDDIYTIIKTLFRYGENYEILNSNYLFEAYIVDVYGLKYKIDYKKENGKAFISISRVSNTSLDLLTLKIEDIENILKLTKEE